MDELTLVREFRADAPAPLAPVGARRALDAEIRPRRHRGRWLASAAAVLVLAGGGLVALQTGPGASPSAAAVLNRAAAAVADDVMPRPRDDQWLLVTTYGGATTGEPFEMIPGEAWVRFDGTQMAFSSSDKPGDLLVQDLRSDDPDIPTPAEWYDGAAALPSDPPALLAALRDGDLANAEGPTEAARNFDAVVETLSQPALPARARADLYRALGTIPGVGLDDDPAPDLLDRPVLSVTFDGVPDVTGIESRRELLLDPQTYDFVGSRVTALEEGRIGEAGDLGFDVSPGQTWYHDTGLVPAVVDEPGQRP